MQMTGIGIVVVVCLNIIFFEVFPERSIWSIPVREADEHMIAVPTSGGLTLLRQKQEIHTTKEQERFWKRLLIVDDNPDITWTFKEIIEDSNVEANKRIEVYTSNSPIVALSEFKPNFYDLLLVDINMPHERISVSRKNIGYRYQCQSLFHVFWRNKPRGATRDISNKAGRMLHQKASHLGLFHQTN